MTPPQTKVPSSKPTITISKKLTKLLHKPCFHGNIFNDCKTEQCRIFRTKLISIDNCRFFKEHKHHDLDFSEYAGGKYHFRYKCCPYVRITN